MADLLTPLLLILVANGAPILARLLPGTDSLARPLDAGRRFRDGRRWLGDAKTWRGLLAAILAAIFAAMLLQVSWLAGLCVGILAMTGDGLSSFVKRRLGLPSGDMALGLDQVPEALVPAFYWKYYAAISWLDVLLVIALFFVLELVLSRGLYRLKIRKHPY